MIIKTQPSKTRAQEEQRCNEKSSVKYNNVTIQRRIAKIVKIHEKYPGVVKAVYIDNGNFVGGDPEGRWFPIEAAEIFESLFGKLDKGMRVVVEWSGEKDNNALGRILSISDEEIHVQELKDNDMTISVYQIFAPGS